MSKAKVILSHVIDVVSGDIITKKGIDKKLPFIIYIFVLIIFYIIWGLMVED